MSQITTGFRSILSIPFIYNLSQTIMGAKAIRRELANEFIKPASQNSILDIGCGTADILDVLPLDVNYCGYDISQNYITAAKEKFGERASFYCGIFNEKAAEKQSYFDIVLMFGVLHHLDDSVANEVLTLIKKVMNPAARLITIDPCFATGQNTLAHFLITQDRGENVRNTTDYAALMTPHFNKVNGVLRHRAWIPYTHYIMECSK